MNLSCTLRRRNMVGQLLVPRTGTENQADCTQTGRKGVPGYLCNLLGQTVCTALQNFDDLLVVGRIFSKADLQLPEEFAALFKGLLLLKLAKRKRFILMLKHIFPSISNLLKQAVKFLSWSLFSIVLMTFKKLGRGRETPLCFTHTYMSYKVWFCT